MKLRVTMTVETHSGADAFAASPSLSSAIQTAALERIKQRVEGGIFKVDAITVEPESVAREVAALTTRSSDLFDEMRELLARAVNQGLYERYEERERARDVLRRAMGGRR